jgi:RNA polymerase primary sigma factor
MQGTSDTTTHSASRTRPRNFDHSALDAYLDRAGRHRRLTAEEEHDALADLVAKRRERWSALLSHPAHARRIAQWLLGEDHDRGSSEDLEERIAAVAEGGDDTAREALAHAMALADRGRGDMVIREVRKLLNGRPSTLAELDLGEITTTDHASYTKRIARADRTYVQARNRFVCKNLRLVVALAKRYDRRRMSMNDLVQEGNVGLMEAVERFDLDRGTRFSTYAAWWIRHRITSALVNRGRLVRVPVHLHRAFMKARNIRDELRTSLGREPTNEELAKEVGVAPKRLATARRALERRVIRLDAPLAPGGTATVADVVEAPEKDMDRSLDHAQHLARFEETFAGLDERARVILRRRFGLDGEEPCTLTEIGADYGLSRERIRQLQNRALGKLRTWIETPQAAA